MLHPASRAGAQRWLVKTLDDPDAGKVNLKPVAATVAGLIALAPPAVLPNNSRVAPVELTTYVVRAVVVERRHEQAMTFTLSSPSWAGRPT